MKPIFNKKATFNYTLNEKLEAGISLTGEEIKAVRENKVDLTDSYALIRSREAVLVNAYIGPYEKGATTSSGRKDRKLLLHKKEINYLAGKLAGANLVVVPTRLYFKRNYAKIEIALASPKKKYDKREALKRKALQREAESTLREEKLKHQKEAL
ncbi:MAG: SsrA-binding protein [Candidatus Woykebacteria bacterium RBG_13_40_15]|uniref:SsrA-binding protein n=1 Tax=Candidatus Woykebacteria bacterium RBG_13_40_15 TaxID=1802593 RepID=A0A1G1W9P5_9BACT|nr:MAG: SsrA-binding protein [Candidatus Woykebacteria bacterium RBG_13_40_15]